MIFLFLLNDHIGVDTILIIYFNNKKTGNVSYSYRQPPHIVQKLEGTVEVGWEKTRNQFFWLNVHKH
jgi:hypothetical protein